MLAKHLPSPVNFREDINGLRAWAVVAVVLYHFQISALSGGFAGVDIFFVISGYLMTAIIVKDLEKGDFSITKFYMARVRRILPALLVVIAILLSLGWFWLPTLDYQSLGNEAGYSLAFLSNIGYYFSSGYFDSASHEKWLLHTWSLAVEAQFYVLFPIFVALLWRLKPGVKPLTLTLLLLFILSFTLNIWLVHKNPDAAFYLLPTRGWELAAGGLVFLLRRQFTIKPSLNTLLFAFGWLFIIGSLFLIDKMMQWPGYWALFPVLGASFVIFAQKENAYFTNNLPAQWLGGRSYSLYLWHWPLVVGLYFVSMIDQWQWVLFALLFSLVLAQLSYQFVETPTRKYLSKKSFKKEVIITAVVAISMGVTAYLIEHTEFNNRVDHMVEIALDEQLNINPRQDECENHKKWDFSPNCIYGTDEVGVLLLGDSHAGANITSLAQAAQDHSKSALQWSLSSCAPIFDLHYATNNRLYSDKPNRCSNFTNKMYLNSKSFRQDVPIVLLGRQSAAIMGKSPSAGGDPKNPMPTIYFKNEYSSSLNSKFKAELKEAVVNTACKLAKDRTVFLVRPIPEMNVHVPKQLSRNIMLDLYNSEIKITLEEYHIRHKLIWWAQDEAVKACGVEVLNPLPYLCDDNYCYGSKNGRPLYFDDDHLSEYGNKLLVPMFEEVFKTQE